MQPLGHFSFSCGLCLTPPLSPRRATYTGIVLSGTVDLIFTCDDERGVSRRSRLASVGPGSVIGAHAMIGKGSQPVSVVANTNVLCMAFSSADHTYRIGPEAQKAFADTAGGYPSADDMKGKLNQAVRLSSAPLLLAPYLRQAE